MTINAHVNNALILIKDVKTIVKLYIMRANYLTLFLDSISRFLDLPHGVAHINQCSTCWVTLWLHSTVSAFPGWWMFFFHWFPAMHVLPLLTSVTVVVRRCMGAWFATSTVRVADMVTCRLAWLIARQLCPAENFGRIVGFVRLAGAHFAMGIVKWCWVCHFRWAVNKTEPVRDDTNYKLAYTCLSPTTSRKNCRMGTWKMTRLTFVFLFIHPLVRLFLCSFISDTRHSFIGLLGTAYLWTSFSLIYSHI